MEKTKRKFNIWCALRAFAVLSLLSSVAYAACAIIPITVTVDGEMPGDAVFPPSNPAEDEACIQAAMAAATRCEAMGGTLKDEVGDPTIESTLGPWASNGGNIKVLLGNSLINYYQCTRTFNCEVCSDGNRKNNNLALTESQKASN